jgi:branched-chain amino acid transport system permease protein
MATLRGLAPELGAAALAALFALAWALAPHSFTTDLVAAACITAILVISWTVFCGPTREINFGNAFFTGGAAYLAALAQTRLGLGPVASLLLGVAGGALLGVAVATLTIRHRALFFSMVTMALQLALYRALFFMSSLFGGEEGIVGLRAVGTSRGAIYATAGSACVLVAWGASRFLRSSRGLLLGACGQNETLARSLGVPVGRLRLLGLALAGAAAGLGGALYALTQGQASAELASEEASIHVLLLGMIGGLWSLPGALLATFALQGVQAALFRAVTQDALLFTALLLGLVLAFPRGLVPLRPRWDRRIDDARGVVSGVAVLDRAAAPLRARPGAVEKGLSLERVTVHFGGLVALDDIGFEIERGTTVGLVGPNGAGKTTLLAVIAGQRRPTRGTVRWAGRSLRGLGPAERARRGLRKTHQHVVMFPELSVLEHLAVARAAFPRDGAEHELGALIAAYLGPEQLRRQLQELPPAAARLTELAMALAAPPDLLLLDEPFAALSATEAEAAHAAIESLQRRGSTIVIVEHRLHELFRLVSEVLVMDHGRLLARKSPGDVMLDPRVLAAYGVGREAVQA